MNFGPVTIAAVLGLVLQAVAAVWIVKLEIRKGRIRAHKQKLIEDAKYARNQRKIAIDEVITQTKATNELLGRGAPKGTPDRYSLDEAVASYVHQMGDLTVQIENLKEEREVEEFPELTLLGTAILVIFGALLQIPLIFK
jgi:hypothetical protein